MFKTYMLWCNLASVASVLIVILFFFVFLQFSAHSEQIIIQPACQICAHHNTLDIITWFLTSSQLPSLTFPFQPIWVWSNRHVTRSPGWFSSPRCCSSVSSWQCARRWGCHLQNSTSALLPGYKLFKQKHHYRNAELLFKCNAFSPSGISKVFPFTVKYHTYNDGNLDTVCCNSTQ